MLGQVRQVAGLLAALWLAAAAAEKPAPARPFEVSLVAPSFVKTGEQGELVVHIAARSGYHVNDEYPHSFRPSEGNAGVRFQAKRFPLAEGSPERTACKDAPEETCALSARVPFRVEAKGSHRVEGVVAFSVCSPDICLIEKVPLAAVVEGR